MTTTDRSADATMTLRDWMPQDARNEQLDLLEKHGDKKVVSVHDGCDEAFPQSGRSYRNVMHWVILEDGSAVGWNESPRSGWSFPRTGAKTVQKRGY